jgi:hypothetical protein
MDLLLLAARHYSHPVLPLGYLVTRTRECEYIVTEPSGSVPFRSQSGPKQSWTPVVEAAMMVLYLEVCCALL